MRFFSHHDLSSVFLDDIFDFGAIRRNDDIFDFRFLCLPNDMNDHWNIVNFFERFVRQSFALESCWYNNDHFFCDDVFMLL